MDYLSLSEMNLCSCRVLLASPRQISVVLCPLPIRASANTWAVHGFSLLICGRILCQLCGLFHVSCGIR